jgi:hypothetical protein
MFLKLLSNNYPPYAVLKTGFNQFCLFIVLPVEQPLTNTSSCHPPQFFLENSKQQILVDQFARS